jgi:hypothetical protein
LNKELPFREIVWTPDGKQMIFSLGDDKGNGILGIFITTLGKFPEYVPVVISNDSHVLPIQTFFIDDKYIYTLGNTDRDSAGIRYPLDGLVIYDLQSLKEVYRNVLSTEIYNKIDDEFRKQFPR